MCLRPSALGTSGGGRGQPQATTTPRPGSPTIRSNSELGLWVNRGGNVAPGQPLVFQNVRGPTQHITPRNGQITFDVTIPPPETPSPREVCPNGNWTVSLTSLTYVHVMLHIQQGSTDILTWDFGTIDPDTNGISPNTNGTSEDSDGSAAGHHHEESNHRK